MLPDAADAGNTMYCIIAIITVTTKLYKAVLSTNTLCTLQMIEVFLHLSGLLCQHFGPLLHILLPNVYHAMKYGKTYVIKQ